MLVVRLLSLIVVLVSSCDRTVPELPAPPAPVPQTIHMGSGSISNGKLGKRVRPRLPKGTTKLPDPQVPVLLQIRIDETGNVVEVHPASSADARIERDPTLIKAAEDSVKQWKYEPTLFNGQPIAVLTTVTVTFPDR